MLSPAFCHRITEFLYGRDAYESSGGFLVPTPPVRRGRKPRPSRDRRRDDAASQDVKEDTIEMDATVEEPLPNAMFRVKLETGPRRIGVPNRAAIP